VRKVLTLGVLVLTLMAVARPAEAHIWDWLQEWSGPGPFSGKYPMLMGSVCTEAYRTATAASGQDPSCVFFDYREVRVWKIQESIEGGVGLGVMLASGDKGAGGKDAWRFTVTAPRLGVMPILLVAELFGKENFANQARRNRWVRILKLHAGGTIIVGPLDAEALGVDRTRSDYSRNSEYVLSRGFVLDFGELIPGF
jgi:hypothetical protein